MSKFRHAVFLDRDGTIIRDVGELRSSRSIELLPDTVNALQCLQTRFSLFVVTNQCWIGEGRLTEEEVDHVNASLAALLGNSGIGIEGWYVCPHARDSSCSCRKPAPGLLLQAARQHDVDLGGSFIVGDHPSDAVAGREYGVRGAYVLTGHGRKHRSELPDWVPVFAGIAGAASWIMAQPEAPMDRKTRADQ